MADVPTAVYRMYDEHGDLLYVGITHYLHDRMVRHAREKEWWGEVANITVEHYPDRHQAETVESRAIFYENPRHNKHSRTANYIAWLASVRCTPVEVR